MKDPTETTDWAALRGEFSAVRDQAYLDCATYGPGPESVRAAVRECEDAWFSGRGHWREWEREGEQARALFAKILGADVRGISLQPAVSVAAAQIAERVPRAADGSTNIVVGEGEFRSNLYPWLAQAERGLEVRLVPFRQGRLVLEDLEAAVDDNTALVAVSSVQSSNGFRIDLERVSAIVRRVGARLFVDATQSVGALVFPIELADYVAVAAYKWLLAPRGSAFLHVRPELVGEILPLCSGWKTPQNPYAGYYGPPLEIADDASRFDVSLAWSVWVGTRAALELIDAIGVPAIEERVLGLAERFARGVTQNGFELTLAESERSHIIGLGIGDAEGVAKRMREASVIAAVRGGYLRASFHFFNDESDVDRAVEVLGRR